MTVLLALTLSACSSNPVGREPAGEKMPKSVLTPKYLGTATLVKKGGVNEFCSFPDIDYVFRFVFTKSGPNQESVSTIQIALKKSKEVVSYGFVGYSKELNRKMYQRMSDSTELPLYFYFGGDQPEPSTEHYFANEKRENSDEPLEQEDVQFSAMMRSGDFICE